jgi:hypothetical protein
MILAWPGAIGDAAVPVDSCPGVPDRQGVESVGYCAGK